MRIVVGISGASGAAVAVDALKLLHRAGAEVHLVISKWGAITLEHECGLKPKDLWPYAHEVHRNQDLAASISSGSFRVQSMLVAPCSARTLAAIANGTGDSLLCRAADVSLKERRRLVLGVREAPLSLIHLQNALEVSRAGAVVYPLVPTFYSRPSDVAELTCGIAARLVDLCGVETDELPRWGEGLDLDTGD